MSSLRIIVGSVHGGAQLVADKVAQQLRQQGFQLTMLTAPIFDDIATSNEPLLVVTSTTGQGELPAVMASLHQALRDGLPWQPNRPFAIIMLGDSSYSTFCGGGEQMREVLLEMGTKEIIPPLRIDACSDGDTQAEMLAWLALFTDALTHADPKFSIRPQGE